MASTEPERGRRDAHAGAATQEAEPLGLLESVSAIMGQGPEFDPHQYRSVEKPTSYLETATHLLKGSIGAGVLAMPSAVGRLGLPAGLLGLLAVAGGAVYCLHLLINGMYESCKRHRRGYMSYKTCMREAIKEAAGGRRLAGALPALLEGALVAWQLGLCAVYAVSAAAGAQLAWRQRRPEQRPSLRLLLLLQLPPLLLVNHFKNLKVLAPVSTAANAMTLVAFVLVFGYLVGSEMKVTDEELRFKGFDQIPIFVGITLFALEAVGVILTLEHSMAQPERFMGRGGLLNRSMAGVGALYCVVGGAGYARYGARVKDSVLLNLPVEQPAAQLALALFSLALFLSFPLQNYVAYQMLWARLHPRLPDRRLPAADRLLRLFCVLLPWLMALGAPTLGPVIGLCGALCLSLLGVVFPALLDLCLWWPPPAAGRPPTARQRALTPRRRRWVLARDLCIMALGLLALGAGVYTSVLDIIRQAATVDQQI